MSEGWLPLGGEAGTAVMGKQGLGPSMSCSEILLGWGSAGNARLSLGVLTSTVAFLGQLI